MGAGAAGLLAATRAAECGRRVLLLEKNAFAGAKILMSGGTRCNLTQATDRRGIAKAFGEQGKFLHSPLAALGPAELIALVEGEGVPTKVEPTGKVFPVSNRAADVLRALLSRMTRAGVELALAEPPQTIEPRAGGGWRLQTAHRELLAEKLIVTTGGLSYPGSGTTGDGYRYAAEWGHTVVTPRPALTPLVVDTPWVRDLRGITAPDVAARVIDSSGNEARAEMVLDRRRGSFLFTHFGVTGPVILDLSRVVSQHREPRMLTLVLDFVPDVTPAAIQEYLASEVARGGRRSLASLGWNGLPRRLVDALLAQAHLGEKRLAEVSKSDRATLIRTLKETRLPIAAARGFKQAEVTAGGIALDEVDSRKMSSRKRPDLYFAGEILDLDGPIGGYNFQAAFSTGWLAGDSV